MWERAKGLIGGFIMVAVLIGIHLLLGAYDKSSYLTQLTMSMYYAVVVLGLALLMGYAGQISLGHGAFFAIGGYTAAILTTSNLLPWEGHWAIRALSSARLVTVGEDFYGQPLMTFTPWLALFAAIVITMTISTVIGYAALRLKGHYLAMATLGFGLIVQRLVLGSSFTGASDGVTGVPPFPIAGGLAVSDLMDPRSRAHNYYIAGIFLIVVMVLLWNLVNSRVGRALKAIHDRETAANAMGINTAQYKLKVFVTSAMLAAMAGVLFTHYTGGIGPSEAGALKSVRYVALAAAGGMANIWAVAVTSISLNFISLRGWFGSYDNGVFGVMLIVIISVAPDGPAKFVQDWSRKIRPRLARLFSFGGARRLPDTAEDTDAAA